MSDLASKVEHALQAYLMATAPAGTVVLTGSDDATKTMPQVVCECEIGQEHPHDSGNYDATATVFVRSACAKGLTAHRSTVSAIFDRLRWPGVAAGLSDALAGFTVLAVVSVDGMPRDNSEHSFGDGLRLTLYCCASDIT